MAIHLHNAGKLTDEDLVRLTKDGNRSAFDELVRRYEPKLSAFTRYICKNEDRAEETCQEALIKAFEAIPKFRGQSSFTTWLHQIAKNLCWSKKRKDKNLRLESIESAAFGDKKPDHKDIVDWSNQPDKLLLKKELDQVLDNAILRLPQEYRAVITLRDIEELSNEEVAQILQLSIPAVKSRLHRARLFVRSELDIYFKGQSA